MLSEYKKILKTKKSVAVTKAQKAYEVFHCFVVSNPQTRGTGLSMRCIPRTPGLVCTEVQIRALSFVPGMDCIELHKLTIFPVDAAEKQHFYMTQTVKKPQ
jgi:hypothetical protein